MSSKILVIGQLPPPVHGSAVMAERFMGALHHNGYSARIVQKTFSRRMDEVGKVTLSKIMRVPAHCAALIHAISEFRPDLCVFFISVGFTALAVDALLTGILRAFRVPCVLYFHGKGYRDYRTKSSIVHRAFVTKTLTVANGGMVLGERLKADVDCYIPRHRLFVVPNGVPDIEWTNEKAYGNNRKVHVIFLSNLVKTKGPMEFLRMAKAIMEKTQKVRFTMVGRVVDEEFYKELLRFKKEGGLNGTVGIPGPLYGKAKEDMLRDADILVFLTCKDVFPLVNLEAMQWGIPVVSTNEGAIPDIIRDGVNGFIVNPENIDMLSAKVLELIRDPALRERMGRAGRVLYERHYSIAAYERNVGAAVAFFLSS